MTELLTVKPGVDETTLTELEEGYTYPLLRCRTFKELVAKTRNEPHWTVLWDNHPVGFFAVHQHFDLVPDTVPDEVWYETVVHVDPLFRGNGVASAVTVTTAEWFARQSRPIRLLVDVNIENQESITAHTKMLPGYPVRVVKENMTTQQWQLPKHPVVFLKHPAYSYRLAEQLQPDLEQFFQKHNPSHHQ